MNPCEHVPYQDFRNGWTKCVCGWMGENHALHVVAMEVADEVLNPPVIEEEP